MRSPLDKFVLMALLAAAAGSVAAQPYVFPSKGQSAEQQQKDEQYCYNWAVQQTGYNPAYRQPAPSGTPSPERGSGAKGALVGGALGAIAVGIKPTGIFPAPSSSTRFPAAAP